MFCLYESQHPYPYCWKHLQHDIPPLPTFHLVILCVANPATICIWKKNSCSRKRTGPHNLLFSTSWLRITRRTRFNNNLKNCIMMPKKSQSLKAVILSTQFTQSQIKSCMKNMHSLVTTIIILLILFSYGVTVRWEETLEVINLIFFYFTDGETEAQKSASSYSGKKNIYLHL